jgi:drug/metabolite transporter (DMT)-like permease
MTAPRPSPVKIVLAFGAVYVLWGSTYLAIRLAIETLPPFLMTGTRFTLAGAILFTWAVLKGERFIPPLDMWRRALVIGGLLLLGGNAA